MVTDGWEVFEWYIIEEFNTGICWIIYFELFGKISLTNIGNNLD